jgi:hypothetical protein
MASLPTGARKNIQATKVETAEKSEEFKPRMNADESNGKKA